MIIIHHIRPAKTRIWHPPNRTRAFAVHVKSFSPRVSNESKAMILITYCRSNAQGDLSHRYMRIRQCSFCVIVVTSQQFLESILRVI